jgi:hypothetical protein
MIELDTADMNVKDATRRITANLPPRDDVLSEVSNDVT